MQQSMTVAVPQSWPGRASCAFCIAFKDGGIPCWPDQIPAMHDD